MNKSIRNLLVWVAIVGAVLLFYQFLRPAPAAADLMDSAQFAEALKAGRVTRVSLPQDATIGGELNERHPDGSATRFVVATPAYRELVDDLVRANVTVRFYSSRESSLTTTVLSWIPMLFLIGVWIYFVRVMKNAARQRTDAGSRPPIAP
jgi:cell division protease FtsH